MLESPFTIRTPDRIGLHVHRWLPETGASRGVVVVAHGMGEHAARYARLAERLTAAGYAVWAHDQRGHGRSVPSQHLLGDVGEADTWDRAVGDLRTLLRLARREHPGLPLVVLGHSMGSFMVQQLLPEEGDTLTAVVLSGSAAPAAGPLASVGRAAAWLERRARGDRTRSRALRTLLFDRFNRDFAPARTGFDWLSRDPDEVDRYVEDPLCGFVLSSRGFSDMLAALPRLGQPARLARIRGDLPVYLFSGERDPVHEGLRGLARLIRGYRAAGLTRVEHRIYADGRHEMLNETNRDEVVEDLLAWLRRVLDAPGRVATGEAGEPLAAAR